MSFFSRLRALMTAHSRNRRTRRREPRSPFFAQAAQVETLEQRCLLSGFSPATNYGIGTHANPPTPGCGSSPPPPLKAL